VLTFAQGARLTNPEMTITAARWRLKTVFVDEKKFTFSENGWKMIT